MSLLNDEQILARLGLDEAGAKDYIAKAQAFLASLSPAQLAAAKRTSPTWEKAAETFGGDATAADLQEFVSRRGAAPAHAVAVEFMFGVPPGKTENQG